MAVSDSAERSFHRRCSHPWLADLLYALDVRLRRHHAVFEYTANPSCIFRLGIAPSPRSVTLRDGTRTLRGRRTAELHFWNEHVPAFRQNGATIAWARQMQQAIANSLHELALFLDSRPDLNDITVIWANLPAGTRTQSEQLARIMGRFGFEALPPPEVSSFGEGLRQFGQNVLISLVVFAQNAGALRRDTLSRVRVPIYLSRRTLEQRFGAAGEAASS